MGLRSLNYHLDMAISKKTVKNILGWILALAIIYFLARYIVNHWDEITSQHWDFRWSYLALAGLILFAAFLALTQAWRVIIKGFQYNVVFGDAFRIMFLSQLGRYIPGKIWQVIGMVGLAREVGLPAPVTLASFVLNEIYFLPAGFILLPFTLGNLGALEKNQSIGQAFYIVAAVIVVVFLIFFFLPGGLNRLMNFALKLIKKEPVSYSPTITNRLTIFGWYVVCWILFGVAFHFFLKGLLAESPVTLVYAIGAYAASYIIGYLSFITPGGLGFREAVLTALLAPFGGTALAASLAFANRIWLTVAEAIISLLALATYKMKK